GRKDFHENNLTILEQKAIYEELHDIYKKALSKALQDNLKSQQLISLLQELIEENNSGQSDLGESSQTDDANDKNKDFRIFNLKNLKKHHGRGRPPGTKKLKSSHENYGSKIKRQRRCRKCGNTGHYQKNCKLGLVQLSYSASSNESDIEIFKAYYYLCCNK
ncbi:14598_t:CDS:2, partial [Cetraspora pellucida]